jgi:hypothetical protein
LFERPYLEKTHHQIGWWSGSRWRPWVQPPVPPKIQTNGHKEKRWQLRLWSHPKTWVGRVHFQSWKFGELGSSLLVASSYKYHLE